MKKKQFLKCEVSIVCFIFITKLTCITSETVGNTDDILYYDTSHWVKKVWIYLSGRKFQICFNVKDIFPRVLCGLGEY